MSGDEAEPASLAEIARRRLARDPDAPFVVTIDDSPSHDVVTRTYGDVAPRAEALAAALADAGVDPDERVGCYLPNAPCWVTASLGVWRAGAAVAAVGTLLPGSEAMRLFELAGVRTVVAVDGAPELPGMRVLRIDDEGDLCGGSPSSDASAIGALPDAEQLAAIFFTSGTTGQPKGITYTHGDMITSAKRIAGGYARNLEYRPDTAPAHLAPGIVLNPFGHTAGYVRLAFRMWIGRATVLIPKFTVPRIRAYVDRYRPDSLQLTPTMIHMLATTDEDVDLTGVEYVTSGTAPLATPTRDEFEARFGVPVMQAYGMTEVGTITQERLDDVRAGRRGPGSVGRAAVGVEISIRPVDGEEHGAAVVDEGQIFVRAKEMPTEFVGGARVPVDDDGWFATGDIGRLDDGILSVTGRVQDMIIAGGLNVYPAEVEDVLKRSPLVTDAVVVGVPDERLGEVPVAGVVWTSTPDEPALLEELRASLAPYKLPRRMFALEAVPLTTRDKVDRRRAAELARDDMEER